MTGGITIMRNWKYAPPIDVKMVHVPEILVCVPMPVLKDGKGKSKVDANALRVLLEESEVQHVAIEKVGAMPGQGVTSMFTFGYGAGVIEGVVASLSYPNGDSIERPPYEFVTPQAWMKVCFAGMAKGEHKVSPLYCSRRWPGKSFLATERSRVPHNGMTDSACIADYLLTKLSK